MLHDLSQSALEAAVRSRERTGTARRGKHLLVALSRGGLLLLHVGMMLRLAVEHGADPGRMPRTWLIVRRVDGTRCPRGRGTVRAYSAGGRRGFGCPACQSGDVRQESVLSGRTNDGL